MLLDIEKLGIAFGAREVVRGVTFSIAPGEMMALVGESGSGKTLTALAIPKLLPPGAQVQGSVKFKGEELTTAGISRLQALRGNDIAMIFQEPMSSLNPLHTIGKQIGEAVTVHQRMPAPALRARVKELLEEVELSHLAARLGAFPHELSGGERQRVMIAMAIANNPELLIADEPTTALDVTVQQKIMQLLKRLQRERGMAMLFITHDLLLVERLADGVAVMQQGRLVEAGGAKDLFAQPYHPYTRHLLHCEPKGPPAPLPVKQEALLSCENVSVTFPVRRGLLARKEEVKAVSDISLALRQGETLGVVGESGSGKTTLAFALLRLLPAQGRIVFQGKAIEALKGSALLPLRKHMQPVFQDPFGSLNPRMTVLDIVAEGLRVHMPGVDIAQAVSQALAKVGLSDDMLHRYPHEFSGGQRQRISLARALVLKPKLIVLDEPTSALDVSVQAQIVALLKQLQREEGLSYLFISHDLRVVRALAHRVVVMRHGQVVEQGEAEKLFTAPQQEYTRRLLEAAYLAA